MPGPGRFLALQMLKRTIVLLAMVLALPGVGFAEEPSGDQPPGFVGPSLGHPKPTDTSPDFVPIPDRWRIGMPVWNRFDRSIESGYVPGHWWDPYNQNVVKGDYPIYGQNVFMNLSAILDTIFDARRVPTPANPSSPSPGSADVFGNPSQYALQNNFILSLSVFEGDTAFKPRDWEFRVTGVFNLNFLKTFENGVVNADVREGTTRTKDYSSFQELFFEYHLADLSPNYDFLSFRAGIQPFVSDFRGFVFNDDNLGYRFFGNLGSNRYQYNAAYFHTLEKDTNSGLNEIFNTRRQHVGIVNYFNQDFIWPGYTIQLTANYLHDSGGEHTDKNGFVVRPALVGTPQTHTLDVAYLGWNGDGHIGPLNVNHSFYQVLGRDTRNPIAGKPQDLNAQMAALELSMDFDWFRPKATFFWASGDNNPLDGQGRGFDAIFDNPNFAGSDFSYFIREGIPLVTTNLSLKGPNSLLPTLRSSKLEGQANYVNPGLFLFGIGADIDVTPKVRLSLEANKLRFHHTEPLELVLFQDHIRSELGWDLSAGVRWRPFLIDNVIVAVGGATFIGGEGFKDIFQTDKFVFGPLGLEKQHSTQNTILYSGFLSLTFTY